MRELRTNKDNLFICEECGLVSSRRGLMNHISRMHSSQMYYDKWLKEVGEGICKICKEETRYLAISSGYSNCCSKKCSKKYNTIRTKEEIIKKYGVENVFQSIEIKDKIKKIKKDKYGNEYFLNLEKAKQTSLKKHGYEWGLSNKNIRIKSQLTMKKLYGEQPLRHIKIKEKKTQTSLKKYSVESPNQSTLVKANKKKSCLEKFGVENPMQDKDIFLKQQKSGFESKKYKELYYRGSYELDFLEKYYDKIDIKQGLTIPYLFEGKNKVYHSDFFIPSLNLIIEIKSLYYYNRFKYQNIAKQSATENKEYKYIKILDKDYTEFNKIIL